FVEVPRFFRDQRGSQGTQRVVRAALRPKSIRAVQKVRLEHRFQDARDRTLNQPVLDCGNAQWSRSDLARPFRNLHPPDGWRPIGPGFQPCANLLHSCFQLALKLSRCLPSTPLAPRRFICRQVSMRNAGVSRCANEVKRSVRSAFALAAICSSCVDIRFLLLSVGDVALAQLLDLRRRFPMCAAFPRAEYYQRLRLPRQHRPSSGWSFQSAYSPDHVKTVVDLPGSVTLPSPSVPCSQTPPESPAPSPLAGAYWCLPRVRPCRPPVATITRLHRFTCVTARTSLCLRLAHVVASMNP